MKRVYAFGARELTYSRAQMAGFSVLQIRHVTDRMQVAGLSNAIIVIPPDYEMKCGDFRYLEMMAKHHGCNIVGSFQQAAELCGLGPRCTGI